MGLFSRRHQSTEPKKSVVESSKKTESDFSRELLTPEAVSQTALPPSSLDEETGLYSVVKKMRDKGTGELSLELNQLGNDMNLVLQENGQKIENTVVVPDNEWFDAVAQLYVDENQNGRGTFNRALITVTGEHDYRVQASFINTEKNTSNNVQFVAPDVFDRAMIASPVDSPSTRTTADSEDDDASGYSPQDRLSRVSQRINTENREAEDSLSHESFNAIAFGYETVDTEHSYDAVEGETTNVEDDATPFSSEAHKANESPYSLKTSRNFLEKEAITEELEESDSTESILITDSLEDRATVEEPAKDERQEEFAQQPSIISAHDILFASATIPHHVDDEWEEETSHTENESTPVQQTDLQNAPREEPVPNESAQPVSFEPLASRLPSPQPASQTASVDLPDSGSNVDVAPSFLAPHHAIAKPSTTEFADGNLVLTEAEVVNRLAGVQEKLFGVNGNARDVSAVLVRVRALGSYYDALTHVRQDGFWDQKRTFELIPEDELNVLQLKADSYKEGFGSPLAISLRFTPGIPVQVQFDYSNESAFAKYSDELPAQQYVEELRMFPRTGANIPEHMSRALASWTL